MFPGGCSSGAWSLESQSFLHKQVARPGVFPGVGAWGLGAAAVFALGHRCGE